MAANKNIKYTTKQIKEFFSTNRQRWNQFYPSERWVFARLAAVKKRLGDVLDVGCACGGLGAALSSRFMLKSYTGIDINADAICWARAHRNLSVPTNFISGDILTQKLDKVYDTVISLGCADWNIETKKIITYCWSKVKPGGYFILSLRIAKGKGINNFKKSYQYIDFSGRKKDAQRANYVVFNFYDAMKLFSELRPNVSFVGGYGYFGHPSPTAITPFKRLIFTVFYIRKSDDYSHKRKKIINTELFLPIDLFLKGES